MNFNAIVSFFTGNVEILIRGYQIEKFINLATSSGLYLWDIKRLGSEVIKARIRTHGYFRAREIARKTGCNLKIHRKYGWPFLQKKALRRRMFFIGALGFLTMLLYISSLVFFIKIDGYGDSQPTKLIASLNRMGLKPGITRKALLERKRLIEREVMLLNPELVWVGITVKGVVAEVKVVPRKTAPAEIGACDIVAAYDGVVSKVVVIRGVPMVKEGDVVAKGDLLISGTRWYNDQQTNELVKQEVAASGVIEANVWHSIEVLEPKVIWKPIPLQSHSIQYKLRWNDKLFTLGTFGVKPVQNYYWQRWRKRLYQGRNPSEVVEFIKDVWQEVSWKQVKRSKRQVQQAALEEAFRKQKNLKLQNIKHHEENWSEDGMFVKLTLTYEVSQDIATIAPRERR
ncbi:MAG TPA: sporulation protein YqfD [Bacillota bacterium]|nr:sporulation protein YqfD [Bacillota bacterium]HOL09641.1 sporulation protein YqfD [Bacillota bacterium]HPO98619.1 sporulation protein YqfD [Bacillota bacterium]